jgi:hypothetical protein
MALIALSASAVAVRCAAALRSHLQPRSGAGIVLDADALSVHAPERGCWLYCVTRSAYFLTFGLVKHARYGAAFVCAASMRLPYLALMKSSSAFR